jgi:hypothetical protein
VVVLFQEWVWTDDWRDLEDSWQRIESGGVSKGLEESAPQGSWFQYAYDRAMRVPFLVDYLGVGDG